MHYSMAVITRGMFMAEDILARYDENLAIDEMEEDGDVFSFNPDGHWDWYQIGGRWAGLLKVKESVLNDCRRGEMDEDPYLESIEDDVDDLKRVDIARIRDVQNIDEIIKHSIYGYVSTDTGWKDQYPDCWVPAVEPKFKGHKVESPELVAKFKEEMERFIKSHPDYYITIADCHD